MKTPDEIKKGLKDDVPYHVHKGEAYLSYTALTETRRRMADGLAYIQQLETKNHQLLTKVEHLEAENKSFMETIGLLHVTENQLETKCHQLEQERDAAVNELIGTCQVCRWEETEKCASCHFNSDAWNVCESNWEWRGVKEE